MPLGRAHAVAELKLRELADPSNGILYLDGSPIAEKMLTNQGREDKREKALKAADKCTTQLMARVTEKLRVRKQQFHKIRKHLDRSFYWSVASLQAFAQYCRSKGWTVIECTTEADIRIANDCGTHDVVISTDSDMLVYKTASRIWRPISKGRFLQYKVSEVLDSLQITRTQLTALGIVSRNDYNRNVVMAVGLGQFSSSSRLSSLH